MAGSKTLVEAHAAKRGRLPRGHCISAFCLLFALLVPGIGAFGAQSPSPDSLFPPGSTLCLLSGLAGDVESENSYHEQLFAWLALLEPSPNLNQVFVLCDDPDATALPKYGSTPAKKLKASREAFLSLGPMLNGQTNRLVVIAWGHGGRQGSIPVFHVRGPRLTPADFKTLADQVPSIESRWVLLFRNSGSFARHLARENRIILSSESDKEFSSDPVGMSLLPKLLVAKPTLSFSALSDEFGRVVASWYDDHNLARTEEPTLWEGDKGPRSLAPFSDSSTLVSSAPAKPLEVPTEKTNSQDTAQSELPASWKEIQKIDPKNFPQADAVVLKRSVSYELAENPAVTADREEYIQILTLEGKRFGDFDISYSPPFEDLDFQTCEVLAPDARLTRLDSDSIREAQSQSPGDYNSARRKFFSLPGVVPGAILHVRYRTQWKEFPLPRISLQIPIDRELPALDSNFRVTLPSNTPFHFVFEQMGPGHADKSDGGDTSQVPDPVLKQSAYGMTYSWHLTNLPARKEEILSSPSQQSSLAVSTFPDWQSFSEWYARISKLADEETPEIKAKAAELTRDSKSDREKVLRVFNYVASLRYVAVPLGVNSSRPHAAVNVLRNQFGDCKDKANLFNSLLRASDFDARLVLVPRFRQAQDSLPGFAFNHAISKVILTNEILWVDTTDDICRFGMLPPGDPGREVLVIGDASGGLFELPEPDMKDHQLTLRGTIDCTRTLDACPLKLTATAQGYPDYELRQASRQTRREASVPLLAAQFRPVAGTFAMDNQTASPIASLDEDFRWQAEGSHVGLVSSDAHKWSIHSPVWLPREWDMALHRRKSPLYLNQGYPLSLHEDFEFTLPRGAQINFLPALNENKTKPLRWKLEWVKVGDDKIAARFSAELERGEMSATETAAFQEQLRCLLGVLVVSASLSVP
jgi:hypothetical protein